MLTGGKGRSWGDYWRGRICWGRLRRKGEDGIGRGRDLFEDDGEEEKEEVGRRRRII